MEWTGLEVADFVAFLVVAVGLKSNPSNLAL